VRKFSAFILVSAGWLLVTVASAAASDSGDLQKITVDQLVRALSDAHGDSDGALAQHLLHIELTERLSSSRLAQLTAALPGEKSKAALLAAADQSALLSSPEDEIADQPAPDGAATRQMLVAMVNYVNTTLRQLPNLIATRATTSFEDQPAEDTLGATGMVSTSAIPLHQVGTSSVTVTYRDHKEVVDEEGGKKQGRVGGLETKGEFGSILSMVVGDALKGKITWGRWEKGSSPIAVFKFAVPADKSSYHVSFCCIVDGVDSNGTAKMDVFDEKAAYHGEIEFDPKDGSILRMMLQAEMPPRGQVPQSGIVVEYGPREIGGKTVLCPTRSVAILMAHTEPPQGSFYSRTNFKGPGKMFLNDAEYVDYRRFGSELKIVAESPEAPKP
jgi:hypothetical protein